MSKTALQFTTKPGTQNTWKKGFNIYFNEKQFYVLTIFKVDDKNQKDKKKKKTLLISLPIIYFAD